VAAVAAVAAAVAAALKLMHYLQQQIPHQK
jgi:hypothetical protein